MPVINYQGAKMTPEQKRDLIRQFTAIAHETTHIPEEYFTVIIQEYDDDNMGSGGKTVTEIRAQRQG